MSLRCSGCCDEDSNSPTLVQSGPTGHLRLHLRLCAAQRKAFRQSHVGLGWTERARGPRPQGHRTTSHSSGFPHHLGVILKMAFSSPVGVISHLPKKLLCWFPEGRPAPCTSQDLAVRLRDSQAASPSREGMTRPPLTSSSRPGLGLTHWRSCSHGEMSPVSPRRPLGELTLWPPCQRWYLGTWAEAATSQQPGSTWLSSEPCGCTCSLLLLAVCFDLGHFCSGQGTCLSAPAEHSSSPHGWSQRRSETVRAGTGLQPAGSGRGGEGAAPERQSHLSLLLVPLHSPLALQVCQHHSAMHCKGPPEWRGSSHHGLAEAEKLV